MIVFGIATEVMGIAMKSLSVGTHFIVITWTKPYHLPEHYQVILREGTRIISEASLESKVTFAQYNNLRSRTTYSAVVTAIYNPAAINNVGSSCVITTTTEGISYIYIYIYVY